MNTTELSRPRLLVSVRNVAEAQAAITGGSDVLDVKEPGRGAMGMADVSTIAAVVAQARAARSVVPVSAALGEVRDWEAETGAVRLPPQLAYLKLGTSGLSVNAGWQEKFMRVAQRFTSAKGPAGDRRDEFASEVRTGQAKWIAVGYADWEIARGPSPEEVLEGAPHCGCSGVLIDTFSKEGRRLFDWLSVERLEYLAGLARSQGLEFALAGRVLPGDLSCLISLLPDIVGIRSAACRGGNRRGAIDADAVRVFRERLQDLTSPASASRPIPPGSARPATGG